MSASPDEKPVSRFVSTIEVESGTYGLLRFRNWTVKAGATISQLCNNELPARRFAERQKKSPVVKRTLVRRIS